jgi:predicted permease
MSAIIEKEVRYALRNAQLRALALIPLVLLVVKFAQAGNFGRPSAGVPFFATQGRDLMAAFGLLYVFMILSSLYCNLFGYEHGGMRTLVLAPADRRAILAGKNLVYTAIALLLAGGLFVVNQIVFGDLTWGMVFFALLCFPIYASTFALAGNWISMRFPRRIPFGKRMNVAGVAGWLVLPIFIAMMLVPGIALVAAYLTHNPRIKYVILAALACIAVALYVRLVTWQGRALARRELDILEAVTGQRDD